MNINPLKVWTIIVKRFRSVTSSVALKSCINNMLREFSYSHGLIHNFGAPQVFAIETTNRCPMTCIMCPRTYEMTRKLGDMDLRLFKRIVDQISPEYQHIQILLHHYGEPVLYSHFRESIEYCRERGLHCLLSTNPSLFNQQRAIDAIEADLNEIRFMVDGMDEVTIKAIRGPAAGFAEGVKNIKYLIEEKKKHGVTNPRIHVAMLRQQKNRHQWDHFLYFWNRVEGVSNVYLGYCDSLDGKEEQIINLSHQIVDDPGQVDHFKRQKYLNSFRCYYPWHSVCILWDGRVVPCCHDSNGLLTLGDLNFQSLKEIWNGEPIKRLRRELVSGQVTNPLCITCKEANNEISLPHQYPVFRVIKWFRNKK